jgi:hypothetical protein
MNKKKEKKLNSVIEMKKNEHTTKYIKNSQKEINL